MDPIFDPRLDIPANWTRVTSDQMISNTPTVLYGIQVYLSGQTAGVLIVRDGQNANAPIVCTLDVNAATSKNLPLGRGILLAHGLFVDLDAYITEATVMWLPFVEPVGTSKNRREIRDTIA